MTRVFLRNMSSQAIDCNGLADWRYFLNIKPRGPYDGGDLGDALWSGTGGFVSTTARYSGKDRAAWGRFSRQGQGDDRA